LEHQEEELKKNRIPGMLSKENLKRRLVYSQKAMIGAQFEFLY
jgi:hypothetical protein